MDCQRASEEPASEEPASKEPATSLESRRAAATSRDWTRPGEEEETWMRCIACGDTE